MPAGSFKFKLVVYFLLLSLLPTAAAFWGFGSVARESEARRVDARLQAGLRAARAAYEDELDEAARSARGLANDTTFQTALANGEAPVAETLLRDLPHLRVVSRQFDIGDRPRIPGGDRRVVVVGPQGVLGTVIASAPFDQALLRKLRQRSGLQDDERVVAVRAGRIVAGPGWLNGRIDVPSGGSATIAIAGHRYRALVAGEAPGRANLALAVLSPQATIDAASASVQRRLLLGLLAAVLMIAIVAYFEGRSIVRTVSSLARAANAIARGQLDERVPVKGRDELARLGNAFNQMADQLQARVEEVEAERRRLRDALQRFGDALAATHDMDNLLRVIVQTVVEATGAHGGMLLGDQGQVVEIGAPGSGSEQLEFPLYAGKTSFGTLLLFGRHFDEDARMTAASLVSQSVTALENARLHRIVERQALIDGLTGLANRRHSEHLLATELARAARFGGPLAVVLGDLDDFKQVNDVHGHPVGDTVLREFAALLEGSVRDVDVAARWGGEEFLLVLPGTDGAGAVQLCERIRALLEETALVTPEGVPIRITASFGVAAYAEEAELDDLISAADAALYQAKRAGKNRVEPALRVLQRP